MKMMRDAKNSISNSFEIIDGQGATGEHGGATARSGRGGVVNTCGQIASPFSARLNEVKKTTDIELDKYSSSPHLAVEQTPRNGCLSRIPSIVESMGTENVVEAVIPEPGNNRGDNPSADGTFYEVPADDEMSTSSESYENWSFVTNTSIAGGLNGEVEKLFDVTTDVETTGGGQEFHSAAEMAEFIHVTDTIATYNDIKPISDKDDLITIAGPGMKSPAPYSLAYNSVSYASALSASRTNTDMQSFSEPNENRTQATAMVQQRNETYQCKTMSSTFCQVHERIVPSPIEMFRSFYLLPNRRYRFHIVYSIMANLRYESIKLLPKTTSKRKVLVPWLVTDSIHPAVETAAAADDNSVISTFRTPAHTPNARLELDGAEYREQHYKLESSIAQHTVVGNKVLTTLETDNYAEVASVVGPIGINKAVLNKADLGDSMEKLIRGNTDSKQRDSLDCEASSNQTSKQVLVGSLNDLAATSGFASGTEKKSEKSHEDTGLDSQSFVTNAKSRVRSSTMNANNIGDTQTLPDTRKSRSSNQRRALSRFFSLLRRNSKRSQNIEHRSKTSRSVDVEAFGDRLSSPLSYDQSTSNRGSFLGRMNRSSSRSRHSTGTGVTFKTDDVDLMVESLYNKFQSDTEFHMMLNNFRGRAKLHKPKHGNTVDLKRDKKLSCSNTTALFREFYPQLKHMKNKKQQKEVVNKVLGRDSHSKHSVTESILFEAFRPCA